MVASLFFPFSLLLLISTSLATEMVLEVEPSNYQEITTVTLAPYEVLQLEIAVQQVRGTLTQPNSNLHHSQYTLLLCKEQQPVQTPLDLQNSCPHLQTYNCQSFPVFSDFYDSAALAFFEVDCNTYAEDYTAPLQAKYLIYSTSSASKNQSAKNSTKESDNSDASDNAEQATSQYSELEYCYYALEQKAGNYNGTPSLFVDVNTTFSATDLGPFPPELHNETNPEGFNLPSCLNGAQLPYYQYFKGPYKVRNLYEKSYAQETKISVGLVNFFKNSTTFEVKVTTSGQSAKTDPNLVLFFCGILIWSLVGLFWLTHFFYSLCRKIKVLPIHVLLIVYFPLRIAHSAIEYVYFLIISKEGMEHRNLFYVAYGFETLSLSLLILIFQLITAGYLVIEKNFHLCKIRKTIILIIFLIASFWLTLLVNWLISIALIVIFFIFLKMVCIDQSKNKNILLNIIKELHRQRTQKAALKIKISLLTSLNRWAWIFTLMNSAALAITALVQLEQKYIYSLIEQLINFLFYSYFLLLFRIQQNDERFKCLDDLRSTDEGPSPDDISQPQHQIDLCSVKSAEEEKHSSDQELRQKEEAQGAREVSLREVYPKDISISLPSGVPFSSSGDDRMVPRRQHKRRKIGLLRSIMLSLSIPGKSLSVIDEGNSESLSQPSQFLDFDDIETCRSFPHVPDTLDIKKKQATE